MKPQLGTRVYLASDPVALPEALRALRIGQIVAFPTDTVYGLGCDVWQAEAVERLYRAKTRPRRLGIPVLLSAPDQVSQVALDLPGGFDQLAARFWPGGLTLIVPRRSAVPDILCAGGPNVAVRVPDHPVALRLIAEMGGALAVTSANLSGRPPSRTAAEVLADLDGRIAVLLDGGTCPGGVASSIVDLVARPPSLLRTGALPIEALRKVLPSLALRDL